MRVYMAAEFPLGVRTSSPSSSPSSSVVVSSPPSTSQTSILIRKAKADTVDSSSLAPPFTTSTSSSAFSPSPLLIPSPSARTVRFAEHVPSSSSSRAEHIEPYFIPSSTQTKPIVTTSSPSTLTSSASSPFSPFPCAETSASSPRHISPTSSAFVSASASPFISPPVYWSSDDSTPGGDNSPSTTPNEETISFRPTPAPALAFTPSFNQSSSSRFSAPQPLECSSLNAGYGASENTIPLARAFQATSGSPSSSTRFRTCDVYIGTHGVGSSLARFSKWLRAELELQGIACFSADRAQYVNARSHGIALRTINSCTFGLVIVTKDTFKNVYSLQEIHSFLHRRNLVPLFFDISPSNCLGRDIVEKRGAVWEKDGGELWRFYDGDEREWFEVLDGLSKVEEWKLEAYDGKWRDCVLKAVSLLGTRLGRRSVAERERVRKEKVDSEEFPFCRNTRFVGREREIKALESLLFANHGNSECTQARQWKEQLKFKACTRSVSECYVGRRRSDADRWHGDYYLDDIGYEGMDGRRKSDSDRWLLNLGRDENGFLSSGVSSTSSASHFTSQDKSCNFWNIPHPEGTGYRGRSFQRFKDQIRQSRHHCKTGRPTQAHLGIELPHTDVASCYGRVGGLACVTGAAGIGKTDLVLEYAYRHFQRYRMVLWVGGEARYLRQNYLNLSSFLGLDVGTESQIGPERGMTRTFNEQEMEAFQRVKRELQRDVPYLLIIDNLESECDWWDGRDISELIPREGATHVILTTRLRKVMNLEPLDLSYLSGLEAQFLMRGEKQFASQELDALKEMEVKLERSTLGLSMVGALLSQLPIMPHELLRRVESFALCQWQWSAREEADLKSKPYLVKLLGVCFSLVDQSGGAKGLSLKMAMVGGWFGSFSVPLTLLAFAALTYPERSPSSKLFNVSCFSCYASTSSKKQEAEASSLLVKYGIARKCSRQGWIHFPEIVQLYARKRGGLQAAKAMVQSLRKRGSIVLHSDHMWAACFLVLGFGNDPTFVELKVAELLSFIRRCVLPLALRSYTSFSRCHAALELLRLSAKMLEDVEKLYVPQMHDKWDKALCCKKGGGYAGQQMDEYVWQDVALLKALILETRAKLMLKGGEFDAGEELCRTCISIRSVMLGHDHPDTICAQETLAKLVRFRSNA